MPNDAKQDPLFNSVKELIIQTKTPSVVLVQRSFLIGYDRADKLLGALEGETITPRNQRGFRKMLIGDSKEYL